MTSDRPVSYPLLHTTEPLDNPARLASVGWLHPLYREVHDHPEDEWAEWNPAVRKAIQKRHASCERVFKVVV